MIARKIIHGRKLNDIWYQLVKKEQDITIPIDKAIVHIGYAHKLGHMCVLHAGGYTIEVMDVRSH